MNAAITLAGWFLLFGLWFGGAFLVVALFYGAFRTDRAERAHRAEQLELDGPLTALAEEQQRRANRAVLAQRDRWSRSA